MARLTAQLSTSATNATALRSQIGQAEAELARARALRLSRAVQATAQRAAADHGAATGSPPGQGPRHSGAESATASDPRQSGEGDETTPVPGTPGEPDDGGRRG